MDRDFLRRGQKGNDRSPNSRFVRLDKTRSSDDLDIGKKGKMRRWLCCSCHVKEESYHPSSEHNRSKTPPTRHLDYGRNNKKPPAPMKPPSVPKEPTTIDVPAITLSELREKTESFGSKALIGEGSYGRVYYANFDDGKAVAVKKLDNSSEPDTNVEFLTQVSKVSRLKNDNFVQLLGYCVEGNVRVLAYEFATMGSLHDVLHGRKGVQGAQPGPTLEWKQRVRVAVDAAKGLEYLHEQVQPPVIHRDIRSSNVLLFEDFKAKIADFNLSNQAPDMAAPFGEEEESSKTDSIFPTSAFKVLTRCLFDESLNKEKYQSVAGSLVMEEIFGTSFNAHLLAAKRVAEEVGSTFKVLDSPFVMEGLTTRQDYSYASALGSSTRFRISNDQQSLMQRLLSSHITHLSNEMESEVPPFAHSVYNLLVELHNIFNDLPAIRKALDTATKMLSDVNNGEAIDTKALSEVYLFRIAVEGLRIALNNTGRLNIRNLGTEVQFSKLSSDDKAYALMADDLRSQAKKFKSIVAVVDAGNLAGLRRHWRTCVPQEYKVMSTEHKVLGFDSNDDLKLIPVVAVGASALTLSNARFFLTRKALAFTKMVYPSTARTFVKSSLSAERIRGVTQYVLTSAESTSFDAMRAAFYAMMMRKRLAKPVHALPLVVLGASLATFSGLVYCEEGIECAAVTLPSASEIAKLGRGIQNLREASLEVTRRGNNRVHNAMEGLTQRLRNLTVNYLSFKPNLVRYFCKRCI
ncbi:unnamed protein product [Eruca vesicaria subsp. sativa]|uniref:Protein kinase domain-containing protein n=1 Tax=Eruca vesicaria subsp. sativa TaxID=29727 RepID=A0ABC8KAY5_ERUVS|nr:unnamed protein product [Eruca vesicaria subsp. sativa]